jgi:hypothetical protein
MNLGHDGGTFTDRTADASTARASTPRWHRSSALFTDAVAVECTRAAARQPSLAHGYPPWAPWKCS